MRHSEEQLSELRAAIRPGIYDGSVSARAQIVLWHREGHRKADIAQMSGASRPTIDKWIDRYAIYGLDGLTSDSSPGGPRTIPGRIRGRVLALTRQTPPEELGISHWSSARMAAYIRRTEGVSVSQPWVSRLWREHGLQPWRQGTFKISKDPDFEEKVRDVTGLYLDPPEGEAVVSVDVKSGIQALDRTQPMLPVDFGKSEKRTHDYKRNGTTDMYAGLDIVTGQVTVDLSPAHNVQDFLRLMKRIVAQHAGRKKIHIVLDNASVHTGGEASKWLAEQGGRVVFHFTPTGASWMNQIEIWNGIITRSLIRRGTFSSVKIVDNAIKLFAADWNADARPFKWTATADEIIDKVRAVTSRMDQLIGATEIGHVIPRTA
ncbi:MAG: IS630 family transposase [Streptosporangiaceae bacterium]